MNYNNSALQDYLNDDDFIRWVLHSENDAHWQRIVSLNPHQQVLIDQARQLVIQLHEAEKQTRLPVHEERVWGVIQQTINAAESQPVIPLAERSHRSLWQAPMFRWAAIVVCMLGVGWFAVNYRNYNSLCYSDLVARAEQEKELIERVNTSDQPVRIPLEDGSVVTLEKNSRLSFPDHFDGHKREVILQGEAFFEVAKNPAKPFFVYANEITTKVLGTSFRIKAFDDQKQVEVNVSTGRVSVFNQNRAPSADKETQSVVLLPNQQALFNREKETIFKRLVDTPVLVKPLSLSTKKRFDDVPASEVLQELEALYGVKIRYNEELLSNCIITTSLGNEPLRDKLDIICQTIGATYTEVDAELVIESKGCQLPN